MRQPLFGGALVGALTLLTVGCSWFGGSEKKLVCPGAIVAPDLDTAAEFRPNSVGSADDLQFGVKILLVDSSCHSEKAGVTVETRTTFLIARNDPTINQRDFTYFVAIADAQRNILAKKRFSLRVEFPQRKNQMQLRDEITEQLPLRNSAAAGNYAIIVGLELSQEQLDFNRKRQAQ